MLDWITVMESISYRAVEGTQRFNENGYNLGVENAQLKEYIDTGLDNRNGIHILSGC